MRGFKIAKVGMGFVRVFFPSGFQELEVRKDDQSYGVSLQHKRTNDVPPLPPIIRKMPGEFGIRDGNDSSGSGSGVIDGSCSGSGSVVNDGSGSGGRGGGLAGGMDVDEAPEHDTSDDGPAPEQGKSPAVDKVKQKHQLKKDLH
nr:hypothetical protein [Tanacetum cinerariifolium]